MNPKLLGAVQLGGAVLAVILGFFELNFFALLLLAIAMLITGLDKFMAESVPAAPAMPAARPAYPPRAPARPSAYRR